MAGLGKARWVDGSGLDGWSSGVEQGLWVGPEEEP